MSMWEERMTPRHKREPRLDLVEMCWRVVGRTGSSVECGIYATDVGLEVRCGYGVDQLFRSQFANESRTAREIANEWRQAAIAKGFEEMR